MHRKIAGIILAACLLFTASPGHAQSAFVTPENVDVTNGDTVSVEVRAENIEDAFGVQWDLQYSSGGLHYTSWEPGPFLKQGNTPLLQISPEADPPNKISHFALTRTGESGASGSGVMATVFFTATGNGTASFQLQNILFVNSQNDAISLNAGGNQGGAAAPSSGNTGTGTLGSGSGGSENAGNTGTENNSAASASSGSGDCTDPSSCTHLSCNRQVGTFRAGFLCTQEYRCPSPITAQWEPNEGEGVCCPVACIPIPGGPSVEQAENSSPPTPVLEAGCTGKGCGEQRDYIFANAPPTGFLLLPSWVEGSENLFAALVVLLLAGLGIQLILKTSQQPPTFLPAKRQRKRIKAK